MQPLTTPRITLRDSVYKAIDPASGLGLRCQPPAARLVNPDVCTLFPTRLQAEACLATHYPELALEIIRFDR